jgi:hypothetical protein
MAIWSGRSRASCGSTAAMLQASVIRALSPAGCLGAAVDAGSSTVHRAAESV